MAGTHSLNYGRLMQSAMRQMMAEVLGQVAEHGLPGEHHFYIGFDTTHPGVDIPEWLKQRYPAEMTIVLQEWFEDLAVMGDRFTVTLNFSDQSETLVIPLDAVQTFVDPSVRFGLKFDAQDPDDDEDDDHTAPTLPEPDDDEDDGGAPAQQADVVSLDSFRKS